MSAQVRERIDARYGPGSEAARAGLQQLFTHTEPAVYSFVFNTHRAPSQTRGCAGR